ncbi:polyprenyl synthetase family protein, partial [Kocuria oceani]
MTSPSLPHSSPARADTVPRAAPEDAFRAEDGRFVGRLHAELGRFFEGQRDVLGAISADTLPLLEAVAGLSSGG